MAQIRRSTNTEMGICGFAQFSPGGILGHDGGQPSVATSIAQGAAPAPKHRETSPALFPLSFGFRAGRKARERERYGGRLAVPRERDERLANPEQRGRGLSRLAHMARRHFSECLEIGRTCPAKAASEPSTSAARVLGNEESDPQHRTYSPEQTRQDAARRRHEYQNQYNSQSNHGQTPCARPSTCASEPECIRFGRARSIVAVQPKWRQAEYAVSCDASILGASL
jgi:hypothetical protein